ncbi:hypothetical protein ACA910_018977 [Epithemia clementina (nom. ined.)]
MAAAAFTLLGNIAMYIVTNGRQVPDATFGVPSTKVKEWLLETWGPLERAQYIRFAMIDLGLYMHLYTFVLGTLLFWSASEPNEKTKPTATDASHQNNNNISHKSTSTSSIRRVHRYPHSPGIYYFDRFDSWLRYMSSPNQICLLPLITWLCDIIETTTWLHICYTGKAAASWQWPLAHVANVVKYSTAGAWLLLILYLSASRTTRTSNAHNS